MQTKQVLENNMVSKGCIANFTLVSDPDGQRQVPREVLQISILSSIAVHPEPLRI